MTYLPDLHTYLHQSSLLIQAYPTTRITTKYSLPRKPHGNPNSKRTQKALNSLQPTSTTAAATSGGGKEPREKRDPAATLTLKTYHADSGICLKYQTDKAQEVGRLLTGLGRLAKGEIIEMPSTGTAGTTGQAAEDRMEVDGEPAVGAEGVVKDGKADTTAKSAAEMTQQQQQQVGGGGSGGGGGKKKKKGGKK